MSGLVWSALYFALWLIKYTEGVHFASQQPAFMDPTATIKG